MRKVLLGDICKPKQWKTISASMLTEDGYPVYGANGVIGKYSEYNHEKETLLITCRGATCGNLNICKPYSYVNGNAMALDDLDESINVRYLYYVLKERGFKDVISGSAQPQIIRSALEKISILIGTEKEQKEIVEKFSIIEKVIRDRKFELQYLDELIKSRFIEMFGGIHDSKLYPYMPIGSFTTVLSGGTPDRKVDNYWRNGNIRWVKTTELQNCVITDTEERITQEGVDNSSAKKVPVGSVLIAMYGQGKTRGMTGYLAVECTTNQACACILPTPKINQTFLWQYMILSYDKLRNMAKGGNQPNLNIGIIKSFPVLQPPMELQEQFVAFVIQIDKSKIAVQKALDETQLLFDSLMQKYFG